jgi:hypothetical protein
MKPQYVELVVQRVAGRAGIEQRVTPHTLRRTLGSDLIDRDPPVRLEIDRGDDQAGDDGRALDLEARHRSAWRPPFLTRPLRDHIAFIGKCGTIRA